MYEQWAAAWRGMRGRRCVLGAGDVAWGWRRLARTGRGVLVMAVVTWGWAGTCGSHREVTAAMESGSFAKSLQACRAAHTREIVINP